MTLDHITAIEIEDMGFTVRYVRPGYDMTEVDLILDQCADTLTVHEANADATAAAKTIAVHQRNTETIQQLCGDALRAGLGRGPLDPARRLAMQILTILDDPDTDDGEAVA